MIRAARLAPLLRVATLLVALSLPAVGSLLCSARARAHELLQSTGVSMLTYARAEHIEAPRTIVLNGAPLHLLSGSTSDSVRDLLDVFHARCRRVGGRFDENFVALKNRKLLVALPPSTALDGVLRFDDARSGYLACLDLDGRHLRPRALIGRIRAFLATGNVAELGGVRFVWAMREEGHTSYVAIFTEGSVPLLAMFPTQGDAPGTDVPGVPRPERTVRSLSAWQAGEAPMLVSYRAATSVVELEASYRAQLGRLAWSVREPKRAPGDPRSLLITRGSVVAVALFSDDGEHGAKLTLMPLRGSTVSGL